MSTEYEATFPNINKNEIRKRLKQVGAKLMRQEFLQKRITFNLPKGLEHYDRWVRVRDEGDKITMSYKMIRGDKIHHQKEICLVVDDFNKASALLSAIGCQKKAYQETKRELWLLDKVEITIDEWPYLEPFVEVEGNSIKVVKAVCKKIGLDYAKAKFCAIGALYKDKYGIAEPVINNKIPRITFSDPNPFIKL